MEKKRYCDPITMDHIIELRKRLAEAERQRDNALDRCVALDKMVWDLRKKLLLTTDKNVE
jgi:hypothetical protein